MTIPPHPHSDIQGVDPLLEYCCYRHHCHPTLDILILDPQSHFVGEEVEEETETEDVPQSEEFRHDHDPEITKKI